jgi:molecular chaperone DnaK
VEIHVAQGERPMAADNTSLGRFHLDGIPPAPRGVPQIEVRFDIDTNGLLNVTAKDLGTGKEASIRITASTKLAKDDIDRMVHEAERYSEEDKKRREEIELVNQADSLVYASEKTITELGDKISTEQKEKVEKAKDKLKESLKTKDMAKIKADTDELTKALHEVSAVVYQEAQKKAAEEAAKQGAQAGAGEEKKAGEGEADYVDVDYDVKGEEGVQFHAPALKLNEDNQMTSEPGVLIVLEGSDGAGLSTQTEVLAAHLRSKRRGGYFDKGTNIIAYWKSNPVCT